jgi:preprotein translocase subunit SecD
VLVIGLTLLAILLLLPTVVQPLPGWLSFMKGSKMSLGLDLQGGTHLIMQVDTDQAVVNSLEIASDEMRREPARRACARRRSSASPMAEGDRARRPARQGGRRRHPPFPNLKSATPRPSRAIR